MHEPQLELKFQLRYTVYEKPPNTDLSITLYIHTTHITISTRFKTALRLRLGAHRTESSGPILLAASPSGPAGSGIEPRLVGNAAARWSGRLVEGPQLGGRLTPILPDHAAPESRFWQVQSLLAVDGEARGRNGFGAAAW